MSLQVEPQELNQIMESIHNSGFTEYCINNYNNVVQIIQKLYNIDVVNNIIMNRMSRVTVMALYVEWCKRNKVNVNMEVKYDE